MAIEKSLITGSTALLVMKLLEEGDKYGYQMVEELRQRSEKVFELRSGTLYPLLHTLEQKGWIVSWEETVGGTRPRRYYHLTDEGRSQLAEKEDQWHIYAAAVEKILKGGAGYA